MYTYTYVNIYYIYIDFFIVSKKYLEISDFTFW